MRKQFLVAAVAVLAELAGVDVALIEALFDLEPAVALVKLLLEGSVVVLLVHDSLVIEVAPVLHLHDSQA